MDENVYSVIRAAYDTVVEVAGRSKEQDKVDLSYVSGQLFTLLTMFGTTGEEPKENWVKKLIK